MKDLLVMLSGFNNESTDSSFKEIAKTLFENYHIQKGIKTYELMEIEFYLYSESHKDIITYPRENDKAGMWFFHMSGVDITFGTTDKNVYGGILIRSIIRTDKDEIYPISGPMKCVEELFDYIHAVDDDVRNDIPRIVKNTNVYNKILHYVDIDKTMRSIPRFIPFRVKKNENIEEKIESKLSDLIRRREVSLNIGEFKDFLKANYRYYIESDEKYWSSNYSACPLESKRGSNDNRYLYMTTAEFTRKCRELQGKYRERMGEPMGKGPYLSSPNYQINMLVNGEETGKNFVNEFTFSYAKRRVNNIQHNETIDKYRLFNNMLSSQPMAFNLFCPFMQMLKEGKAETVTRIFRTIFPDKYIGEVTKVELEYLDTKIENYLNDCTAMDAIVRYKDTDGKPAFIAIETKYTDVLGENTSGRKNAKYDYWIEKIGMFKPDTEAELIRSAKVAKTAKDSKDLKQLLKGMKVVTQIYRNFLLTECYGIREGANRCYSVVLAPAQHPTTEKEVASLRDELKPEYQYKISAVSLEDFVERTLQVCPEEDKAPFLYFKDRYIPE